MNCSNVASESELREATMIIYGIRHKESNKWYVGQSYRSFYERYPTGRFWKYAPSQYLKNVYAKYGETLFEVYLLYRNISDLDELDRLEIEAIKQLDSIYPHGYNFDTGGQRYEKRVHEVSKALMSETHRRQKAKARVIYDKTGKRFEFNNLCTFCQEHGLDGRVLSGLYSGHLRTYKGWYLEGTDPGRYSKNSKRCELLSPEGELCAFYNVTSFAEKHSLDKNRLYAVLSGKSVEHRGYHLPNTDGKRRNRHQKYESIRISKNDIIYELKGDIGEVCSKIGIGKREVYTLTSGEQRTARGFKLVDFTYTKQYLSRMESQS